MAKRIVAGLLGLALIGVFTSCASIQRSRDQGSVRTVAGLINQRDAEALNDMSAVPFLLDQEIVVLDRDVAAFWRTALQVGFRVEEPELESGTRVTGESYREFYDSMEVRVFFSKYLRRNTRLLELTTRGEQRILLLVSGGGAARRIHGFKGPF